MEPRVFSKFGMKRESHMFSLFDRNNSLIESAENMGGDSNPDGNRCPDKHRMERLIKTGYSDIGLK
jgi:hypothetical protein